ncbi:MAG: hypothetical protein Q4D22_00865 [Candidatus Saccharibacteria bacterium]|nr:hypothetical protein [Candidatus Saccharibacteria bacterium]
MKTLIASIESQISQAGAGTGAQTDASSTVTTALNVVFGIIGVVGVVMIVLGGVSYITSQGDPGKIQKGKNTILYGVIGIVVALLAFAIVNFVIKAL